MMMSMVIFFFILLISFVFILLSIAFFTLLERKILSLSQIRVGPNKISVMGIFQPVLDGLKLMIKELVLPHKTTKKMILFFPLIMFYLMLQIWLIIPQYFSSFNLKWNVLGFLIILGLSIYSILMTGNISSSKFGMIGSIRASAQNISYEISLILILFSPILLLFSFNLNNFMLYLSLNNSNLFLDRLNFSFKIEIKDFLLSEKIFLLILLINFCGLSGSWESFSGWPLISISMSIFCWIIVLIRWMNKNIFDLLSHLTPSNLSFISILGLTLIEILSNMIRPLTLGMRLCANILGGHLILDLMSEMGIGLIWKMFLVLYESFVCFMQSLIFSLLLLSYFEEGSF